MRRFFTICLCVLCSAGIKAQFLGYPEENRRLELYSEPIVGLDNLYVGDEGYITFSIRNTGNQVYRGPLFIRIFEREHSFQVLVNDDVKLYPDRVYEITTVFSTDRLAPFVRYFIRFEYIENRHLVNISNYKSRPIPNFSLMNPIINQPYRKSPVKPRIQQYKISKYDERIIQENERRARINRSAQDYDPRSNATRQENGTRRTDRYSIRQPQRGGVGVY